MDFFLKRNSKISTSTSNKRNKHFGSTSTFSSNSHTSSNANSGTGKQKLKRFRTSGSVASVFLPCLNGNSDNDEHVTEYKSFENENDLVNKHGSIEKEVTLGAENAADDDNDKDYQPENGSESSSNSSKSNRNSVCVSEISALTEDEEDSLSAADAITKLSDVLSRKAKRRGPSKVKDYFGATEVDNKVQCKICKGWFKTSGNTSNQSDHLKRKHRAAFENFASYEDYINHRPQNTVSVSNGSTSGVAVHVISHSTSTEGVISQSSDSTHMLEGDTNKTSKTVVQTMKGFFSLKYKKNSKRRLAIDRKIAAMCARDFQPLSIVENRGFNDLINYIDPKYPMISRKKLTTKLLPDVWEESIIKLRNELENSIGGIALTTDCWTSTANQSYLGITCHYINKNFQLSSAALDTVLITHDEKAETLREILNAVISEWNITKKVVSVVTDNAANMYATAKLLNLQHGHLPCFAHTLNIVVKSALKETDRFLLQMPRTEQLDAVDVANDLITKAKNLVTHFHSSSKSLRHLNALKKAAKKRGETVPTALKQQIETRWNSIYHTLRSVLDNLKFIKELNDDQELGLNLLKKSEVQLGEDLCEILQFFDEVTCAISAEIDGLKLTDVHIPRHIDRDQPAVLSCNFDLGNKKLYSVKWYKDEFEFFRYMPDANPKILTFPQNGVNLDLSKSNMTVITLSPLNFTSSGSYRCEVSTDGPNFETVVKNGNMTVMVFPVDQPIIEGIKEQYAIGEYIIGNCTCLKSNPAAELSWYINNDKADSWLMERYPLTITNETLYSTALGLKFQAEEHYFTTNNRLELRCEAKIADLPPWKREKFIKPFYHSYSNQRPAPDSYRNNNGARKTTILLWTLLLTLCLTYWPTYSSI